jgi:hypothetical protein
LADRAEVDVPKQSYFYQYDMVPRPVAWTVACKAVAMSGHRSRAVLAQVRKRPKVASLQQFQAIMTANDRKLDLFVDFG